MRPFAIAGIQMHLSALHSNVPAMQERLNIVMRLFPWVEMVMFSELAPLGPFLQNAQPFPNNVEEKFQEMAARHKIWLLPGSMFEKVDNTIYNTSTVIDPAGHVVGRYRKMFPFYPYEEGVTPGDKFLVFDVPEVARFGVSICYDMWFPETTRTLAAMGAEVILHPTLTGTIDRKIELSIAQANAAMNQVYFFDINGLGDGGNGASIICGPHGDIVHQAGTGPEIMPLEIDLDRVKRAREIGLRGLGQLLKSFRDRKVNFEVYDNDSTDPRFGYLNTLGPLVKPMRRPLSGSSTPPLDHTPLDPAPYGAPKTIPKPHEDETKT